MIRTARRPTPHAPTREELAWFLRQARAPRLRTLHQFAEAEIVIPDGPFPGRRLDCQRQPYTALLFDAIDRGPYNRVVATGPTQSGKTLSAFVVPILYHLFEWGETVICGLPDMDMAADKWREDLLPVIHRTRFRDLLPVRGGGSRGGRVEAVKFRNGATLKFMSGGGGDKSRAGFTARVLAVTETDGLDQPGAASREADKLTQLEARTRAYGSAKRVYLECTVSTTDGRTWQEYQAGTQSAIRCPCPYCHAWVTPDRDHLQGWKDAPDELAAREAARWYCPACAAVLTEDDRRKMNLAGRLLHRGQEIGPDGRTIGPEPHTRTLAVRWSAFNNLFATAADLGADEWRAARAADQESAQRELSQFVWALPIEPDRAEEIPLAVDAICRRRQEPARGFLPADTTHLALGVDPGKRVGYFLALAGRSDRTVHVADYGTFDIPSDDVDLDLALLRALRDLADLANQGWPIDGQPADARRLPDQVWIDSNYQTATVHQFIAEAGHGPASRFKPITGRGASQHRGQLYTRPRAVGQTVRKIGPGWHLARLDRPGQYHVVIDADQWKTWVHARLATPIDQPGALSLHAAATDAEHLTLAKHLTAERAVTEFLPRRGTVTRWQALNRANHYLDCAMIGGAALDYAGFRLLGDDRPPGPLPRSPSTTPPQPAMPAATAEYDEPADGPTPHAPRPGTTATPREPGPAGWFAAQTKRRRR